MIESDSLYGSEGLGPKSGPLSTIHYSLLSNYGIVSNADVWIFFLSIAVYWKMDILLYKNKKE